MENANLLLRIGSFMYKNSRSMILFGPFGLIALVITLLFCGEHAVEYMAFSGHYAFVNIMIGLWYLMIAIGACVVFPYFMGLILIGIGQIAKNTDASYKTVDLSDELPDL